MHFKKAGQTIKLAEPEIDENEHCNTHSIMIKSIETEHFSSNNEENYDLFESNDFTVSEEDIDKK